MGSTWAAHGRRPHGQRPLTPEWNTNTATPTTMMAMTTPRARVPPQRSNELESWQKRHRCGRPAHRRGSSTGGAVPKRSGGVQHRCIFDSEAQGQCVPSNSTGGRGGGRGGKGLRKCQGPLADESRRARGARRWTDVGEARTGSRRESRGTRACSATISLPVACSRPEYQYVRSRQIN